LTRYSLIGAINHLAGQWEWDPHVSTPPDILHDADLGVFKAFFEDLLELCDKASRATFNRLLHELTSGDQAHPDLYQFSDTSLAGQGTRLSGKHYRAIMRLVPLIIPAVPLLRQHRLYQDLLHLATTWNEYYRILTAPIFTDDMIDTLLAKGVAWGLWYQQTLGAELHKEGAVGATIKAHDLFVEFPRSIRDVGLVGNTDEFEELHKVEILQMNALRVLNGCPLYICSVLSTMFSITRTAGTC
jgi:hypothetical protein